MTFYTSIQTSFDRTISKCSPSKMELYFTGIASDGLKGRVFECSLADLQNDEIAFRKFRLIAEEVQGRNVLTNFHGMNLTTDKLRSMVKKWQVRIVQKKSEITVNRGNTVYDQNELHAPTNAYPPFQG